MKTTYFPFLATFVMIRPAQPRNMSRLIWLALLENLAYLGFLPRANLSKT